MGATTITENNIFLNKTIAEIHREYDKKTLSPLDVANACISAVEKHGNKYRAWVCFDKEMLLEQSKKIKERLEKEKSMRNLEGIPVGVKDIFNTKEFTTEMGSLLWKNFTPGNDARVVYYIRTAGGTIPGKTETAEFAVHTLGNAVNPHDAKRTPGTSSSGSAVAIATGMVPVSLGTQTAGSIVRPASFCGIYGCKPSFGLIPRTGSLKTTDSLDTIGYFVAHFEDLERVFDVVRVHGPNYPLSYNAFKDKKRQDKKQGAKWRVAFVRTHTWNYAPDYAKKAVLDFSKTLAEIKDIELFDVELPEDMNKTHEIHSAIYDKTLSYYFKEEFKRSELVSPVMKDLIQHGNKISVPQYQQALKQQEKLIQEMDGFFQNYDILISLSTAGEAPLRHETEKPDPALMWTMTHLPVISVPLFVSPGGLPFGAQIAARKYNDMLLFKFCRYLLSLGLIPDGPNPLLKI